jgi:hypothetical protein
LLSNLWIFTYVGPVILGKGFPEGENPPRENKGLKVKFHLDQELVKDI